MSGHIYCAIIDCYPDYVKVGCTTNIDNKMNNLSASSHIDKFKCIFSIEVEQLNMFSIEKNIHQDIINAGFKRFKGREFFNCKPNDIKYIFDKYDNNLIKDNISNEKKDNISNGKKENIYLEGNQKMSHNCKICDYSTNILCNYERHLKSKYHCENNKEEYLCEICDKKFSYNSGLSRHKKTCINNENIQLIKDPTTTILLLQQKVKFLEETKELESKLIKAELESKLNYKLIKAELESKLIKEKIENKMLQKTIKRKNKILQKQLKEITKHITEK
jgi:hypothetical protein